MIDSIQIIKQNTGDLLSDSNCIPFCSKMFTIMECIVNTVIIHEDFPLITEDDIRAFTCFCEDRKKIVVSGCKATLHPYRLIFQNNEGFCRPLVNIPQSLRGNRHLYPDLFQLIPALLFIPQGTGLNDLTEQNTPDIYIMDEKKLFDKTRFPDSVYLSATKKEGY